MRMEYHFLSGLNKRANCVENGTNVSKGMERMTYKKGLKTQNMCSLTKWGGQGGMLQMFEGYSYQMRVGKLFRLTKEI